MIMRCRRLGLLALMVIGTGLFVPRWATAQSAADKATARQLATEGIQLFRQDRFADALDKLERAQSLFDAPVHLLYIARCQAKLSHLVESAEAYRRLVRVELSAQAPQTFKDAVADGQKELVDIEPKVPSLRVEVTPANAKDLRFTIDGESVSTAVLGVDRPINPGTHVVEIASKGQAPVSRRVEVPVASKQVVKIDLPNAATGAALPSSAGDGAGSTSPSADAGVRDGSAQGPGRSNAVPVDAGASSASEHDWNRLKIIAGIDLTGVMPIAGALDNQAGTGPADDRAVSGRYGPGGGLELRAGLAIPVSNFAISPLVFLNANSHDPGSLYKKSADRSFSLPNIDSVMTAEPVSVAIGLGARIDTVPSRPFQLGGFGELGFVLRQGYSTSGTWTVTDSALSGSCDFTEEFTGVGLRTRGGVVLPVSRAVSLVGGAGITLATITSAGMTSKTCNRPDLQASFDVPDKAAVPSSSRAYHAVFGLTLGAEFGIGLGR